MWSLKFFVVAYNIWLISSTSYNHQMTDLIKGYIRLAINAGDSVSLIVDYSIINENTTENIPKSLLLMMTPDISYLFPIILIEKSQNQKFLLMVFSNITRASNELLFEKSEIESSSCQGMQDNEKCESKALYHLESLYEDYGCILAMKSCRLSRINEEKLYNIQKEIILILMIRIILIVA